MFFPDEDNHTSDLTLTAEQLLEKLQKDPELCRKRSKSGGTTLRELPHSNVSEYVLIDAVAKKLIAAEYYFTEQKRRIYF